MTHTQTQGADGAGTMTGNWRDLLATAAAALDDCDALFCAIRGDWSDPRAECREGRAKAEQGKLAIISAIAYATPAPAATPGVPDSVREAFAAATDSPVFVHDFADPAVSSAPGCQDVSLSFVTPDHITAAFMGNGLAGTIDQARKDAVALAAAWNHVRALIAAQPAGQAGDAGAEQVRDLADAACFHFFCCGAGIHTQEDGCGKLVPSMAALAQAIGFKNDPATNEEIAKALATGSSAPETSDAGKCIGCGKPLTAEEAEFLINTCDACEREEHESRQNADEPAPNSTRTGAAETEREAEAPIYEAFARYVGNADERASDFRMFATGYHAALAARPEAPSDAGWSFDMEAAPRDGTPINVGRDNGCGWDLLVVWWSKSASEYPWHTEGGGEYPEHRFDCWATLTPPSDPAPSGQAEG